MARVLAQLGTRTAAAATSLEMNAEGNELSSTVFPKAINHRIGEAGQTIMSQTKGPGVGVITSEPRVVRLISAWHLDGMPRLWAALPSGSAPFTPWEIPRAQVNVTVVTQAMVTASAQLHQHSGALGMPGSSEHSGDLFERPAAGNCRRITSRPSYGQPGFKKESSVEAQELCFASYRRVRPGSRTRQPPPVSWIAMLGPWLVCGGRVYLCETPARSRQTTLPCLLLPFPSSLHGLLG